MLIISDDDRALLHEAGFIVHNENKIQAVFTKECGVDENTTHCWSIEVLGHSRDLAGVRQVRVYGSNPHSHRFEGIPAAVDALDTIPPKVLTTKEET